MPILKQCITPSHPPCPPHLPISPSLATRLPADAAAPSYELLWLVSAGRLSDWRPLPLEDWERERRSSRR
jgi:hypothetical protein